MPLCPYCFESFVPAQAAFRCIAYDPARCMPEADEPLQRYQRLPSPPMLPRVFAPGVRPQNAAVCQCGTRTTKKVCPHCHNELPGQFEQSDAFTLAMIGSKDVGKSHYVGVLIHQLNHRVGADFNASLGALDDHTIRRYREDFRRYLFDKRETIPQTRSARADLNVRYPLVYRMSLEQRGLFGARKLRVATLVFFDTAGEDLGSYDSMSTETRYIANSDGLLLLVDPLQVGSIRDQLGVAGAPNAEDHPGEIVDRVVKLIREYRELPADKPIPIPVAMVVTKMDLLWPLFDSGSPVRRASEHPGFFNLEDAERVHEELRSFLARWCEDLDRKLRHHFPQYSYFGVSALGADPVDGRLARGVSPFRVEDPFLWLLYRLKLIRGKR